MRRHWTPCRVCGAEHENPMSSSICPACGTAESAARERAMRIEKETYEASPLGQFMSLPEDERWAWVFERLSAEEGSA